MLFLAIFKSKSIKICMKNFFVLILFIFSIGFPSSSYASHIELDQCIEVAHCAREQINVENIDQPLDKIKEIVQDIPRIEIVENNGDYFHAEATSRFMKYVDDLEISFLPETKNIIIRSESRVGEGDFGVNKKRIELIKNKLFEN